MIDIINYGSGNLRSLQNALDSLGLKSNLIDAADDIQHASTLLFPGVGAFGYACKRIDQLGIRNSIRNYIDQGKPFLGICLGMQLLFESSDEDPHNANGLGVFKGRVHKFNAPKIPHMGWNNVIINDNTLPLHSTQSPYAYFVHSYYCQPTDESIILGRTDYHGNFTSMVKQNNVMAMQFHPEKSGPFGLALLRMFLDYYEVS